MSQIRVELQLEDKSFVSGVWRAGQSLKQFQTELARTNPHFAKMQGTADGNIIAFKRQEEATRSLGQRMRDLSIIAGGATLAFRAISGASNGTIGNIVRINAEMERLRYQLAGMSSAADPMAEANAQVRDLQKLASETPFSVNELSKSFVKLTSAGLNPAGGSLRALTDGLAAFGASDEQLHRVTIALTQMQGKGVLSMEELRQQLGESMPNAMQLFARSMGVTVGELAKLVSSGMVESTSAIQKFMSELDRSYAGTGKFMMQTFSGQMARIRSAFTELVAGEDSEIKNAFTQLKGYMGELADWLSSPGATNFFDGVGLGLQKVMSLIESLSGEFVRIKDFFVEWGPVIAVAIGGVGITKAIGAVASGLLSIKVAYQSVAVAARLASAAMISSSARLGIANSAQLAAINAQAAAALAARQAGSTVALSSSINTGSRMAAGVSSVGRAAGAMGGLLAAGSRFLGVLGPIGLALGVLGPVAWEIGKGIYSWATGAKEAKDAIDESVASSVEALKAQRATQREFIIARRDAANARQNQYLNDYGKDNAGALRDIAAWQSKLDSFDTETQTIVDKFLGDSVDAQVTEAQGRIDEATRLISRDYHKAMNQLAKEYQDDLDSAASRGESIRSVQERNRNKSNAERIKLQNARIKALDAEIAKLEAITAYEVDPAAINKMMEERRRLQEEMKDWKPEDFMVDMLGGVESDDKKFERLADNVQKSKEKFKELQAEVNGASGELAKLLYKIERGDFGNFKDPTEQMIQMRDALIETTIAVEALDGIMKGLEKTNGKVARGLENAKEENLRLRASMEGVDPTNEYDFYKWQRENGELQGLGDPEQVVKDAIAQVTGGVDASRVLFEALGKTIRADAFGEDTILRIDQTGEALGRVKNIAAELQGIMSGGMANGFTPMPGFLDAMKNGGYNGNLAGAQGTDWLRYSNQGATRDKPITQDLAKAMSFLKEMGIVMEVFSGGQDALGEGSRRTGSTRHDHGNAADARFYKDGRMLDWAKSSDTAIFEQIVRQAKANGVTGFGAGAGYMSPGSMHLGYGKAGVWGDEGGGANAAPWLKRAYNSTSGPYRDNAPQEVTLSPDTMQPLVQAVVNGQEQEKMSFEEWTALNEKNRALAPQAKLAEDMRAMAAVLSAQTAATGDDKVGTNERRVRETVSAGDYKGADQTQIDLLISQAIKADKHLADLQERQKDLGKVDTNREKMEDDRREVEQRRLDALARAKDPNYKEQSTELRRLNELEREQLGIVERLYGLNSKEYKAEVDRLAGQRAGIKSAEAAEALVELSDATRSSQEAADQATIKNERTLRQQEFDKRMKELAALRDRAIADGMLVAQANILYEQAVAAERARLNEETKTALSTRLDEMAQYGERINASTADFASGLSGALYDSFSDPDAFKNFGNSIRESIARSLTDAAAAAFMKPFEKMISGDGTEGSGIGGMFEKLIGGLTGGDFFKTLTTGLQTMMTKMGGGVGGMIGKGEKGAGAAGAKGSKSIGVKHGGGIIGQSSGRRRMTNLTSFAGAPKFHGGGVVGRKSFSMSGFNPTETPIVAQAGEGIFTPEQMKHLGGNVNNRSVSINAPISVHANGGTPEQNADLARQMAEKTEKMFRGIVHKELMTQMRPGGMLR